MIIDRFVAGALGAALLLSLNGPVLAAPGDWPHFRGPNYNDISPETGLVQDWPAEGPPLVWKATGLGDGFAGVAVVGNRIYTAGDKGDSSFVLALNAADGRVVWSVKLGKGGPVGMGENDYKGPRGTPTIDGGRLYAVSQYGELVCLATADGKALWRKDYLKDFGGTMPTWGYSESALVDGERVVVTPGGADGSMVALDKQTGALLWRSKGFTDAPHYSTPLTAEIGGVRQYIQLTPQSVVGVAAADGKLLWRAARKGNVAVIPSPIYRDGLVYVTSGYGAGCNLFKITAAGGQFSAEQVYANKVMSNHHGGVILIGNYLYGYADGKGWTCQDFGTGEAKWQDKNQFGKGSLVSADGRLYLRQEDNPGALALIEASPEGYHEHGRFNQPSRSSQKSWPHPVIAGAKLYVRDQDVLLCYDVKAK
ncbi:MAG TPA: PQQ-binding-like beta-propeller repeat protein [Dongiaceae bacterium]|nr:PQQ-binding-like beta-propeller repeat protein [Dongiaceae bacterium]